MADFIDDDTEFWVHSDRTRSAGIPGARRPTTSGTRARTHHIVQRSAPLPRLERGHDAGSWPGERWPITATLEQAGTANSRRRGDRTRRRGVGVDPRLLRLGVVAVAMVLMVPVALAVREDGSGGEVRSQDPAASAAPVSERIDPPATRAERRARRAASNTTTPPTAGAPAAPATQDEATTSAAALVAVPVRAEPEPACAGEYTVVAGDYWVRFVEATDADLDAWLRANDASVDTPLYSGDVLCIPEGASAPAPPTTAAPATTAVPATTEPPATTAPPTAAPTTTEAPPETQPPATTDAPATTAPPATTAAPPVSPGGAAAVIREIWPDELEEKAITIAERESSLQPDAYNGWCCYGLFQIYFDANHSFLASLGVTTPEQLLNAHTNAMVAYAMYQRSGWSPWASTNY